MRRATLCHRPAAVAGASVSTAVRLAPASAAWATFVLCRALTRSFWAALFAGYSFGFSAYFLGHIAGGHLVLVLVFPVPILLYLVVRWFDGAIEPRTMAALTGLMLAAQFLLSVEIFATATMFFGNGFGIASTFSRMPGIRDQLGSSPDQLAFALVCMGIGSVLGMPFAGRLVERYSSRTVSLVATALFLGGCSVLPLSRSLFVFGAMLLVVGVGAGLGDVAMNVQGHLVETRRRRVLMPYWHGIFSIGGVAGSLCGWFCAGAGVPLSWQLPMVSAVLLVVMGLATTHYLQDRIRASSVPTKPSKEPVGRRSENRLASGSTTCRPAPCGPCASGCRWSFRTRSAASTRA